MEAALGPGLEGALGRAGLPWARPGVDKFSRSPIVGKLSGVLGEGVSERETTGQDSKAQRIKASL